MRTLSSILLATLCVLGVPAAVAAAQAGAKAPGNDDCLGCHGDPGLKRGDGRPVAVDAPAFEGSAHGALTCVGCHEDLAAVTDFPHADTLKKVNCASCHDAVGATYHDSIHARARERAGLIVAPSCADCHGRHDILGKANPKSRVAHAQVPATCGTCHQGIKQRYDVGAHAAALAKSDPRAPVCADCHTAHAIQRADTEASRLKATAECGTCHLSVVESFGRTFHGKVTQLGSGGAAACADCHGAHDILPAANPASMVSGKNRVATCSKCHKGVTESFVQYDPHPNPRDYQRGPVLWWANRFYWILIPACFGFFGLHSLLWLRRSIKDSRQGAGTRR